MDTDYSNQTARMGRLLWTFDAYFTTLQLVFVPCGGGRHLPVHHHSADYISFLWDHLAHRGIFESGVLSCVR